MVESDEREVEAWWSKLSPAERCAIGVEIYGARMAAGWVWTGEWNDLAVLGQRMRLHVLYDERARLARCVEREVGRAARRAEHAKRKEKRSRWSRGFAD